MIVSVNQIVDNLSTADKYKQLFAKAYQALEDKSVAIKTPHEDKAFHTLDEYFAHLADLYVIDPTYILLPLDETTFDIDANKRTIYNPNIVVMQNDQLAETILFTIDRFFDFKDLATADIYVQWTLPDGKTSGATRIELKDYETIPGKIRFGWPLDTKVTSQKGKVQFSVRFWNKDESDVVVYSLNTLTSSLTINESLQPELTDDTLVDTPLNDGFFKKAIINSNILTENSAIPLNPRFEAPGLNLPASESLLENKLTLTAQAITSDAGELSYKWYYKLVKEDADHPELIPDTWYPYEPGEEEVEVKDKEGNIKTEVKELPGFKVYGGTVADSYERVEGDKVAGESYYMLKGDDYVAYDGSDVDIYERYTTYTVPEGDVPVTGQYKVVAVSKLGVNTSPAISSKVCQLVSPEDIVFTKNGDLKEAGFLDDAGKLTLSVDVQGSSEVSKDERSIAWYKSIKSSDSDSMSGIDLEYEYSYEATEPGWYQARITAKRNREEKEAVSTICKVTKAPAIPTVTYDADLITDGWSKESDGATPSLIVNAGDKVELGLIATIDVPNIDGEAPARELYSESLDFQWQIKLKDQTEWVNIEPDDNIKIDSNSLTGKSTLTITAATEEIANGCTIGCTITNNLNGKSASISTNANLKFVLY